MKKYFKPIKEKMPFAPDNYLGTILGKEDITDVFLGGKTKCVGGAFAEIIDNYIKSGGLIEISKEEAALLFGRI